MKAIVINFSEDRDVGILYLTTKFELDRSTNNGSNMIIGQESLETQTDRQTDAQTESDTLPI